VPDINSAKACLDSIIRKGRVDLYKPIQIAEVLYRARTVGDIDVAQLETYRNPSIRWRDAASMVLVGKASSSSARYQHDLWNETAMPPAQLVFLNDENIRTGGLVERYIYSSFSERQATVGGIFTALEAAAPEEFHLDALLEMFQQSPGIKRSIDKAYELIVYALFETIVCALEAQVSVQVPDSKIELLQEFSDLAEALLGLTDGTTSWGGPAHVYRVGVTNAADRGLDMWANFGPAIQVKHLTLDEELAESIVDQIESDHIVVVYTTKDESAVRAIAKQIGWGKRVRAIVTEKDLIDWYEKCVRGQFAAELGPELLSALRAGFAAEFPQLGSVQLFMESRAYTTMQSVDPWTTELERSV
jgi:hypothetical protein